MKTARLTLAAGVVGLAALVWSDSAYALGDCLSTVTVKRTDTTSNVSYSVAVSTQIRGGWLKSLGIISLSKAGTATSSFPLDFGCNVQRHWQFKVQRHTSSNGGSKVETRVVHYPDSELGWTKDLSISLGDVSTMF